VSCEVVTTREGARAMLDHATGEVMHPVVGPAIEAQRLYCGPARLAERLREEGEQALVLFDVGLGAGSNASAAWRLAESVGEGRRLEIVSFERDLEALRVALEHAEDFGLEGAVGVAARGVLERGEFVGRRTRWRLVLGELPETLEEAGFADMVFWDPFSPRANPGLWSLWAFARLRGCCRDGATVHTYSGATAVRSGLLLAGFAVGEGPATGEHKSATMGALRVEDLERPLDRRWLLRLGRSSAGFPADAPADALARVGAMPQFGSSE
jgi:queuine tRNA-ribosyltransferase